MGIPGETATLDVEDRDGIFILKPSGAWTVANAAALQTALERPLAPAAQTLEVQLDRLERLDTAGAWLIYRTVRDLKATGKTVTIAGATAGQQTLLEEVAANDAPCPVEPVRKSYAFLLLEEVGRNTVTALTAFLQLVSFLGEITATAGRIIVQPRRMRWTPLVFHMEEVGLKAMPIVGLLAFLIGIVIAQQGEFQLRQFGAEIFVVNLLGVSILREIAILITAILIAGRSGSAFTAEIGTMVLNEEVDAMRTLGIDPIETLVMPRLLAIIILMPLLTFYADIIALFGGGMFCWLALDIKPAMFLDRLHTTIDLATFNVGMIKAPFFGAVIAIAGCYEGLRVSGGAESVGRNTTRSVVKSIFLVIVLDAFFAIFFSAIGM